MKYKLGEKHTSLNLYRIVALKNFADVEKGDIGGWVEGEHNLSQESDCWVYNEAKVFNKARVSDHAVIKDNAVIKDYAVIRDRAVVFGSSVIKDYAVIRDRAVVKDDAVVRDRVEVKDRAVIRDNTNVSGRAVVKGYSVVRDHASVHGIRRTDGYAFSYVPDNDCVMRVTAGCRYFTMDEAREHWTKTRGGTALGDETMVILDCLEALSKVKPEGCV